MTCTSRVPPAWPAPPAAPPSATSTSVCIGACTCTSDHLRPREVCLPYRVEVVEGVGRCVVATRLIAAGEVKGHL